MASNRNPSQNQTERGNVSTALSTKVFSERAAKFEEQFSRLIPSAIKRTQILTGQRVVGLLVNLWMQNEDVRACAPSTILNAAGLACAVGLEFNNALGQSYIIPYNNSRKIGGEWVKRKEATWQAGYRGLLTLAQRSEKVETPYAGVVMPDDEFDYQYGTNQFLHHKPVARTKDDDTYRDFTHAYFYVKMLSGGWSFHVMDREEVIAIKQQSSQAGDKSPWNVAAFVKEMIRKTPTKQHLKYLDLTSHLSMAVGNDDAADAGSKQDVVLDWKDYSAEDLDHETKTQTQGFGPGEKGQKQQQKQQDADDDMPPFDEHEEEPQETKSEPKTKQASQGSDVKQESFLDPMISNDQKGPFSTDMFSAKELEALFETAHKNGHVQNRAQLGGLLGRWEKTKGELLKHVSAAK